eukprot:scaffold1596_cov302-Pinguiococcus_pyrenoidosus.AAC.15
MLFLGLRREDTASQGHRLALLTSPGSSLPVGRCDPVASGPLLRPCPLEWARAALVDAKRNGQIKGLQVDCASRPRGGAVDSLQWRPAVAVGRRRWGLRRGVPSKGDTLVEIEVLLEGRLSSGQVSILRRVEDGIRRGPAARNVRALCLGIPEDENLDQKAVEPASAGSPSFPGRGACPRTSGQTASAADRCEPRGRTLREVHESAKMRCSAEVILIPALFCRIGSCCAGGTPAQTREFLDAIVNCP